MEILDHSEQPAIKSTKINWKTYTTYLVINFVLVVGSFILAGLDILDIFPLFESPLGILLLVGLYLVTLFFYKKVIQKPWRLLFFTAFCLVVAGIIAVLAVSELMGIGSSNYIRGGLTIWLFYSSINLGIFRLLHILQKRRTS